MVRERREGKSGVSGVRARAVRKAALMRATCVAVVALFAGCSGFRTPIESSWQTVSLGLCEDYPEESRTLEKARSDLALARDVGAKVFRISFGWDAMEPERGVFDWSFWDEFVRLATHEYGLRLIPYVCYTPKWAAKDQGENFWRSPPKDPADFGRFMSAIVSRYRHAIHSWEIWNEPDNPAYWLGTVEEFAALVRVGSQAVRAADPLAQVVLGGIATELKFLDSLFRVQRIAPAVDIVNLHSYYETWHPDPIERLPEYIEDAAEIVRTHGEREPLWMAETGYSSVGTRAKVSDVYRSHWRGEHSDDAQATALARIFLLALGTRQLSIIAWYRINDLDVAQEVIGDDNNRHLGLRRTTGAAKPASHAFAQLGKIFQPSFRVVQLPVKVLEKHGADPVVRTFALRDNRYVVTVWMANTGRSDSRAEPVEDRRRAVLRVELPFEARSISFTNASGRSLAGSGMTTAVGRPTRQLTLEPHGSELILCVVGR
jgi:hypothetical protein